MGTSSSKDQSKLGQLVLFADMDSSELYATTRQVGSADECHICRVMEILCHGPTQDGYCDLLGGQDGCWGHVDFCAKQVLAMGPATGRLFSFVVSRGSDWASVEQTLNLAAFSRSTLISTGRQSCAPR